MGIMRIRNGIRFATLAALPFMLAIAACSPEPTPTPTPTPAPTPTPTKEVLYDLEQAKAELAAARALWEARGSDDYIVDAELFEGGWGYTSLVFTVRNGILVEAMSLETDDYGGPVSIGGPGFTPYKTIEELFDSIEGELRGTPPWSFTGIYDPYYGYPISFGVSENAPDAAWGLSFSNYRPLASPTSSLQVGTAEHHASVMDLFAVGGAVATLSVGHAATLEEALEKGLP